MKTNTHPDPSPWRKTRLLVLGSVVLVVGALALVWQWHYYKDNHPLSDSKLGFQFYEPGFLPSGFRVTDKRVSVFESGGKVRGVAAEMNFRTEDWAYGILESRHAGQDVHTDLRNFDPTSKEVTCTQGASPSNKAYRLCHWLDYGRISVYEIQFVQEGTFIDVQFPAAKDVAIHGADIEKFIDSFAPAKSPHTILRGI